MNNYQTKFQGYWLERNKAGIPAQQGLYLVYRSKYHVSSNTVDLLELLYIGKSENVQNRIANHDKLDDFKKCLKSDEETISYSFAPVNAEQELDILENALIFAQKPVLNDLLKDSFNYDPSSFDISGQCALLKYTNFKIS